MTALSADRNTPMRAGEQFEYDVAATTEIFAGSLVVLDSSGNLAPGTTATGKIAAGRAEEYVDNSAGGAGDLTCKVRSGTFRWANGESITKAHIGDQAYITDDQTVCRTATGKSPAGVIVDVDSDGVWVHTAAPLLAPSTGLLAANNLSDVGSAATSRSNLGLDTGDSPTFAALTVTGAVAPGSVASTGTIVGRQKTANVAGSLETVGTDDGDEVILAGADNDVVALPAAAAGTKGLRVTVVCTAADGAAKVSVSPNAADAIYGSIPNAAADSVSGGVDNKDLILTKATQNKGDFVTLVCDGVDGWYIVGGVGIWASEA